MLKCLRSCPSKIIESGRVVIYAVHYTCSNVDLNFILVAARTSGFIFQIIDSLMASRGVHLTGRDCIPKRYPKHTIEKRRDFKFIVCKCVVVVVCCSFV